MSAAWEFWIDRGGDGEPGMTRIIRADGRVETLAACAAFHVAPGDVLEVLTPGSGGCGHDNYAGLCGGLVERHRTLH
ncbi:MAG: hydantoinase B/oxoprolinase family protein [Gammaproteobacteria bacterium]|nr:hydantoinase B/oxoprolinase family protein [Gammaproteobacteria bacterium]